MMVEIVILIISAYPVLGTTLGTTSIHDLTLKSSLHPNKVNMIIVSPFYRRNLSKGKVKYYNLLKVTQQIPYIFLFKTLLIGRSIP